MNYHKIYHRMWKSRRFRESSDDFKLATTCLLTHPHRISEGLYWLPLEQLALTLNWTHERTQAALAELIEAGFIAVDTENDLICLLKALWFEAPNGGPSVRGAANRLIGLPDSPLRSAFMEICREKCPELWELLEGEGWPTKPPPYPIEGVFEGVISANSDGTLCHAPSDALSGTPPRPPLGGIPNPLNLDAQNRFREGVSDTPSYAPSHAPPSPQAQAQAQSQAQSQALTQAPAAACLSPDKKGLATSSSSKNEKEVENQNKPDAAQTFTAAMNAMGYNPTPKPTPGELNTIRNAIKRGWTHQTLTAEAEATATRQHIENHRSWWIARIRQRNPNQGQPHTNSQTRTNPTEQELRIVEARLYARAHGLNETDETVLNQIADQLDAEEQTQQAAHNNDTP